MFHLRDFFGACDGSDQSPSRAFQSQSHAGDDGQGAGHVSAIDFELITQILNIEPIQRRKRAIFVDTRDANMHALNNGLMTLRRRSEKFELITVGPVEELSQDLPRTTLPEYDEVAHIKAMLTCGIFLSTKSDCPCDHRAVQALASGCWPVVPESGVYPELIPHRLHAHTFYDGSASGLASRIQDTWHLELPEGYEDELAGILNQFDPIPACRAIDERMEQLAGMQPVGK
jgi:hypothetical protein